MVIIYGAVRLAARPPSDNVMVPIGHSAFFAPLRFVLSKCHWHLLRTAVGNFKWPNAVTIAAAGRE